MSQPTRVKDDPTTSRHLQFGSDSIELGRFVESSLLRDRRLSERERIVLVLHYEWGFNLKEIGDVLAVSESRASQVLTQALSSQKKRIQAADASEEERNRQCIEQETIPREIQTQSGVDGKTQSLMEKIRFETNKGMVQKESVWSEEPQEVRSFAVASF